MANPSADFDDIYKIVLLGDTLVGKTCFLSAFIPIPFSPSQKKLYNDFEAKTVALKSGKKVNTQIWDLSGETEFRDIANLFYKDAAGAFVLFDLTNSRSFASAQSWVSELKANSPTLTIILLGNKLDKCDTHPHLRQISSTTASSFARIENITYIELSSTNENEVCEAFSYMLEKINSTTPVSELKRTDWLSIPAMIGILIVLMLILFNL